MGLRTVLCLCLALAAGAFAKRSRIVGGRAATIDQFPYLVSIRNFWYNEHLCGGSIISDRHILTAAHCIVGHVEPPFTDFRVYTGVTGYRETSGGVYSILRVHVHPGYIDSSPSYRHDIAVITLAEPIRFDYKTQRIALPSSDVHGGEIAVMSGWGSIHYPSNLKPLVLQKTQQRILEPSSCYAHREQICALHTTGIGICEGDSGGPLVVNGRVVGVASNVVPCGKGFPDVYTRVYSYLYFIKSIVENPFVY